MVLRSLWSSLIRWGINELGGFFWYILLFFVAAEGWFALLLSLQTPVVILAIFSQYVASYQKKTKEKGKKKLFKKLFSLVCFAMENMKQNKI